MLKDDDDDDSVSAEELEKLMFVKAENFIFDNKDRFDIEMNKICQDIEEYCTANSENSSVKFYVLYRTILMKLNFRKQTILVWTAESLGLGVERVH